MGLVTARDPQTRVLWGQGAFWPPVQWPEDVAVMTVMEPVLQGQITAWGAGSLKVCSVFSGQQKWTVDREL